MVKFVHVQTRIVLQRKRDQDGQQQITIQFVAYKRITGVKP